MKTIQHKTKLIAAVAALALLFCRSNAYSQVCKMDSQIYYSFISGTQVKDPGTRSIYGYNSKGENNKVYLDTWDDANNKWEDWRVWDYTYNASSKMTKMVDSFWVKSSNQWIAYNITTYQYNGNGSVSQILEQHYDDALMVWKNNFKEDVAFNSGGDTSQIVRQVWTGSAWQNSYKIDYTYTGNFVTQTELQTWNTGTNAWQKGWITTFHYNSFSLVDAELFYTADATKTNYEESKRTIYLFDGNGIPTSYYTENYNKATSKYTKDLTITYTYNSNNCRTVYLLSKQGTGPQSEIDYFYSQATAIGDVAAIKLQCYPVPAGTTLTVMAGQPTDWTKAIVTNTIGQPMPVELGVINGSSTTINVQNYPQGIYFLQVDNIKVRFIRQ